jgi:HEAT repeat protein
MLALPIAAIVATSVSPTPALRSRVELLASQLTDADRETRTSAERELLALGPDAIEPLVTTRAQDAAQEAALIALLPRFGPTSIDRFVALWKRANSSWLWTNGLTWDEFDRRVPMAVAAMGDLAIPALRRYVELPESPVARSESSMPCPERSFALRVLKTKGTRGADELVTWLESTDPWLRYDAASALVTMRDRRAFDTLLQLMGADNEQLRWYAAAELGKLGDSRAAGLLLEKIRSGDEVTRCGAAQAFIPLYEPRFRTELYRMARADRSACVKQAAASSLRQSRDAVSTRLGRRYQRPNYDDSNLGWRQQLFLVGMALLMHIVLSMPNAETRRVGYLTIGGWLNAAVLLALGFCGGFAIPGVTAQSELLLLTVCIPVTGLATWFAGPSVRRIGLALPVSAATVVVGAIVLVVVLVLGPHEMAFGVGLVLLFLALLPAIPVVWLVALAIRRPEPPTVEFRRGVVAGGLGFYVGYAIGWLALWGYLGF